MNAQVQPIPSSPASNGIAILSGRIESTRKLDDEVYTVIKLPAPDEYSMPGTVEVASAQRLGSTGEDVKVRVVISGMSNKYSTKDGEIIKTARNFLTVLER